MTIQDYKHINCGNDFYERFFEQVCQELDAGQAVKIYVDCIGHTRNNTVQEIYKEKIEEKYGDAVTTHREDGGYSYSYTYQLTQ